MDYVAWIHDAATLGGEGVEHYDEFFRASRRTTSIRCSRRCANRADHVDALLLAQFHAPDPDERARQVERQKVAIDLCVRLGTRYAAP